MPVYTIDEMLVLNHFFTSVSEDVYAVHDSMPMSLWGYLAGLSSRTHLGVRERFLNVLKEVLDDSYENIIEAWAKDIIRHKGVDLTQVMQKASSFLEKWGVNYGHNSLKDSCVDRIVVDNCSIRVAKILEESSLGAFQEKSTRYMDFKNASTHVPDLLNPQDPTNGSLALLYSEIIRESDDLYSDVLEALTDHYKSEANPSDFKTQDALERTAKAKAFDTARYCLLTGKPTALAFTMPSRETERHLAALLAHENHEVVKIASSAIRHARIVNPGLLTHVQRNPYVYEVGSYEDLLPPNTCKLADDTIWFSQHVGFNITQPNVWLSTVTSDILEVAASAVLASSKLVHRTFSTLKKEFAAMPPEERTELAIQIMERRLGNRGKHDPLPKEFGIGSMVFEICLDYGAYRDLQRHRVGTQLVSSLDARHGFNTPDALHLDKFSPLLERYRNFMMKTAELHAAVREVSPSNAEYVFALGHNVLFTYICDLRQLAYVVELRSTPQGHASYRNIVVNMFDQFLASLDVSEEQRERVAALFRVHRDANTDRRNQENTSK